MPGHSPKLPISVGVDTSVPAAERYRILGRIASGGMAEIYLARMMMSSGQEREVVLKRLMPELQSDHEFVQMFYDEARIASQMRHPNIVQIYELGELDGSLFISMELLRGMNLRDLLARLHAKGDSLPLTYGIRVACGALEALAYAHRFTDANGRLLNVVHRDVSPQNIIVTYDGVVKLVDFGVAKAEGRLHQTRAGLIKGKFAYMSPEQISGGRVDGRSDQFALAEVFYELFLRRHPFFANSDMEVLRAILDADPPHPSTLDSSFSAELGAILMRALRKNPQERYPNAAAMLDAFEAYLERERAPVTSAMLAKFVREVFADRIELEKRARESGDERMLIESMTAGRAEPSRPKKRTHSRPAIPTVEDSDPKYVMPSTKSGRRDRVVEIARTPSSADQPADGSGPAFIARSGYTDPSIQKKRFQSQIHRLFDDPAEPTPVKGTMTPIEDGPTDLEYRPSEAGLDEGEMPTMLGNFSPEDMEEIRRATEKRRAEKDRASAPTKPPASSTVAKKAVETPARATPSANVTPRSRTLVQGENEAVHPSDRWGLFLFVAGLGALVGAIVYAIILYTGAQAPVMRLEIRSTPAGASIVFDGADTAQQTPTVFQNIASNREHTLELRLSGYEPHVRRLPPSPEIGELIVNWTFRPAE
jgi:serine/threonine protein kinase